MLLRAAVHKPDTAQGALSRIGKRFGGWPAIVFALLSLLFGSAIIVVNPPLRGPDEISHFLRIYSYTQGQLLPVTSMNGRKGIFVERGLYDRLHFFKDAGERFSSSLQQHKGGWLASFRDEGIRYGQVMAEYHDIIGARDDEAAQAPVFAPFAGTEGYSPVAYAPYIIAATIGRLFSLDLPQLLFLMRFFGLVVFTAVTAYAIAITPTLRWAFVLIAMLPVSLYNRVVLSADGAALSYALVITAVCLRAAWNPLRRARLGALAMDDFMCTRQTAADCVRAVGVDVRPTEEAPGPVEEHCDRGTAGRYPVAAVGGRSFSGRSGVARPGGTRLSDRAV